MVAGSEGPPVPEPGPRDVFGESRLVPSECEEPLPLRLLASRPRHVVAPSRVLFLAAVGDSRRRVRKTAPKMADIDALIAEHDTGSGTFDAATVKTIVEKALSGHAQLAKLEELSSACARLEGMAMQAATNAAKQVRSCSRALATGRARAAHVLTRIRQPMPKPSSAIRGSSLRQ